MAAGSMAAARAAGKARIEGRDYVMRDGDVVEFRFNRVSSWSNMRLTVWHPEWRALSAAHPLPAGGTAQPRSHA